jgi:hypothetical protein
MSDLSPKAAALLAKARRAPVDMAPSAKARMRYAVLAGASLPSAAAGALFSGAAAKVVLGVAAVAVGASSTLVAARAMNHASHAPMHQVAVVSPRPSPLAPPAPPPVAPAPVEVVEELAPPAAEEVARVAPPPPVVHEARPRAPRVVEAPPPLPPAPVAEPVAEETPAVPPRATVHEAMADDGSSLREELDLLHQALAHAKAKEWAPALETLDQYRGRFPHGTLADEGDALRVLALCGVGRDGDALGLYGELRARAPATIALKRLEHSCVDP